MAPRRTSTPSRLSRVVSFHLLLCAAFFGISGHADPSAIRSDVGFHGIESSRILKPSVPTDAGPPVDIEKIRLPDLDKIGYVRGLDDPLPEYLEKLGLSVDVIPPRSLLHIDLNRYSVISVGQFAYSIVPELTTGHQRLMEFVEDGGLLMIQLQDGRYPELGVVPFPFSQRSIASIDDVSLQIEDPGHKAYNFPNRLDDVDWQSLEQANVRSLLSKNPRGYTSLIGAGNETSWSIQAELEKGIFSYSILPFSSEIASGNASAARWMINLLSMNSAQRRPVPEDLDCWEGRVLFRYQGSNHFGTFSNFGCDGAPRNC